MQFTTTDLNKTVWVHPDWQKENRERWIVDARGKTLGRLAVEIAKKLQGKHKAHYADHWDTGDYIVVLNADKIVVTWNKLATKMYYRYSGYKGNLKSFTLKWMMEHKPLRVLELAVRGMLPKNKLRKIRMARLKLFTGEDHPYADKNPLSLDGTATAE
jgi:large subunit ribosomal protein L13